ncbi:uncharacterized protein LOC110848127 [Folsomia candida]|uniref:Uncharacterized protein n=1 Tax=Folsomia candida TaxID=158441 RepID=A0A226EF31_FOLCA|nr:uncharacterized protein LOC110848127 [Folsomia candida]OXA55286.1 hypothetical protein Fcan01_09646 [Folsomia candida]
MGSPNQEKMSRLQVMCYYLSIFDIFFYFGTIIVSVAVEHSVTELRPMKLQFNDNGTLSFSLSEKNELMAIWDYLYSRHYSSSSVYNAVYMSLVVIAVTYLIIEVWLCCLLIRGAKERSVLFCKKWFWWRIAIMVLTVVVAASDLYQMQYTLTLLIFIPLNVFRMAFIVLVLHLIGEYTGERGGGVGVDKMYSITV